MRKNLVFTVLLAFFGCMMTTTSTGCKAKEGCGLEEKYKADLSTKKRGKSRLFKKKKK